MAKTFSQIERVVAQQIIDMLQAKINVYFGKDDKNGEILVRKISLYQRDTFRTLLNIYVLKYIFEKEDMLVDLGRSAYTQKEIKNIQQQVNVYINGWISQWIVFRKHHPEVPVDNLTAKRSKVFPWIDYDADNYNKFLSYLTVMYSEAAKVYAESCVYPFLTEEEAAEARSKFPDISFVEPDNILSSLRTDIFNKLGKTEDTVGIDLDYLDVSLRHIVNNLRGNIPTLNYEYRDYPAEIRQTIKEKHGQFIDYCYDQVLADKGYIYGRSNENVGSEISEDNIPTVQDFEDLLNTRATTEAYWGLYTESDNNPHAYSPSDLELVIELNKKLVTGSVVPDFVSQLENNDKAIDYTGRKREVQGIRIPSSEELTGLRNSLFEAASGIAIKAINTTRSLELGDLQEWHAGLVKTSEEYQKENGAIDPSIVKPIINAAEGYAGDIVVKAITSGIYNEAYLSGALNTSGGDISRIETTATTQESLILQPNRIMTTSIRDTTIPSKPYIVRRVQTTNNKVLVSTNGQRKVLPVLTVETPEVPTNTSVKAVDTTSPLSPLCKLIVKYKIKTAKDWVRYATDNRYHPVSTTKSPTTNFSKVSANRVATTRDFVESEEIENAGKVFTTDTPPVVEILSTAPVQTTTPVKNKHLVIDGSPASAFATTYNTFSGTDMVVSVNIRLDSEHTINKIIGSFQTIDYSIYNDKAPVRVIGDMNPRRFVFGPRFIAGSMVFTVFDRHWMRELFGTYVKIKSATEKYALIDELPEMNITISMANEYGQAARLALYGVVFVQEGQIMSVNDIYTENTCRYFARGIDYMDAIERAIERNKRTDIIPIKIVSVQEGNNNETVAVNPQPKDTSTDTDTTVVDTDPPPGNISNAPPRTVGDSRYAAIRHKVRQKIPPYTSKEGIDMMVESAREQYIEERQNDLRELTDQAQKLLLEKYNIKEKDVMTNGKLDEKKIKKLKNKWKNSEHNDLSLDDYISEYKGTEETYTEEAAAIRLDEVRIANNVKEECYALLNANNNSDSDVTVVSTDTDTSGE